MRDGSLAPAGGTPRGGFRSVSCTPSSHDPATPDIGRKVQSSAGLEAALSFLSYHPDRSRRGGAGVGDLREPYPLLHCSIRAILTTSLLGRTPTLS
jgi:hypothetical protein